MYKILIVEDDDSISSEVRKLLAAWGFDPICTRDFGKVLETFVSEKPHLALIDIALPFFNGYHWCEKIRKISNIPIIFISSNSDSMNIVMAMNMGADDFIAKPFDGAVLIAKVQALLRRSYDFASSMPVLEHRGAFLSTSDNSLTYKDEKIDLTRNEYRILIALMENKGNTVSREKLMERLWETDSFVDENTLTVNINRLRKKLDSCGLENFITTKVGMGYIVK